MNRRDILQRLAMAPAATLFLPAGAQEAGFPSKPIRILVGSVPGTLTDQSTRLYAEKMSVYLKQPVTVDNVAGAGSLLAIRQALKSPADGYTLLATANTVVMQPHMSSKAGYAVKELAGIGEMVRSPHIIVTGGSSPYKTLADLVAAAKRNPGQITYGTSGVGTTNHLTMELLSRYAGIKLTQVPYKGIAQAVPDVVAGRVGVLAAASNSVAELMKNGTLRALAISSDKRSPQFPEIRTFKELGYPEATFELWIGIMAPAGIPRAVRARLGEAMEAARNDKDVIKRLEDAGQDISSVRTPDQFEAVMRADETRFAKLIKDANIAAD